MKVAGFNGSPRADGNTGLLLRKMFERLEEHGISTELIQLGGNPVHGCRACGTCFQKKNRACAIENDMINSCIEKMIEAEGIIIGSPTYFANVTAEVKALIDRAGLVAKANGELLKRKLGAAVVAVRRGGAIHVFNSINNFFLINQVIVVGSSYWNMGVGLEAGDVLQDAEGMDTITTLADNFAWLMKKIY